MLEKIASLSEMITHKLRTIFMTAATTVWDFFYGLIKIVFGIVVSSPWYIIHGIYYLLLGGGRAYTITRYMASKGLSNNEEEQKIFRHDGLFLILLGISYFFINLWLHFYGGYPLLPDFILFILVLMSLAKLATGVHGVFYDRHAHSMIVKAIRIFSFFDACVTVVMTIYAIALINDSLTATNDISLLGLVVSGEMIIVGLIMVLRKK